jgi:hypothetical protein
MSIWLVLIKRVREKTSKGARTYHSIVLKLTSKSIQSLYRFQITLTETFEMKVRQRPRENYLNNFKAYDHTLLNFLTCLLL